MAIGLRPLRAVSLRAETRGAEAPKSKLQGVGNRDSFPVLPRRARHGRVRPTADRMPIFHFASAATLPDRNSSLSLSLITLRLQP